LIDEQSCVGGFSRACPNKIRRLQAV